MIEFSGYQKGRDGYYYKYHNEKRSWSEAQAVCKSEGGNLAIIGNAETRDIVREMMPYGWIGVTDQWEERKWQGPNKETITYFAWDSGQPQENEDCVAQWKNKKWHDHGCQQKKQFICQHARGIVAGSRETIWEHPFYLR